MSRQRPFDGQDLCQGGFGHAWFPYPYEVEVPSWCVRMLQKRCDRCDKMATLFFDSNNDYTTKYTDPAGWRKHNVVRKIDVAKAIDAGKTINVHNVVPIAGFERRRRRA